MPGRPGSVFTANCQVNALPIVNDQTFTTPENTANGTVIATIAFSDADPGEVPAITVTGGTGSTAFAVSSSGAISGISSWYSSR